MMSAIGSPMFPSACLSFSWEWSADLGLGEVSHPPPSPPGILPDVYVQVGRYYDSSRHFCPENASGKRWTAAVLAYHLLLHLRPQHQEALLVFLSSIGMWDWAKHFNLPDHVPSPTTNHFSCKQPQQSRYSPIKPSSSSQKVHRFWISLSKNNCPCSKM